MCATPTSLSHVPNDVGDSDPIRRAGKKAVRTTPSFGYSLRQSPVRLLTGGLLLAVIMGGDRACSQLDRSTCLQAVRLYGTAVRRNSGAARTETEQVERYKY
eukprot:COSAG01_NODE_33787_length_558_cov_2.198257_1_plen_102_part_10